MAQRLGPDAVDLFATDGPAVAGSNGWLLAAERTGTGAALLAGDPHRFIEDPGVYQQIRLACPEYDVVGLAVPGVPGIAHFGHTGAVAWAITNAMADYQDVYAERLRRDGPRVQALGPDGWRPAHRHVETIEVAGAEPVEVEVVETDRGPVIAGGPDDETAVSLRYPPRVRGDLGFATLPSCCAPAPWPMWTTRCGTGWSRSTWCRRRTPPEGCCTGSPGRCRCGTRRTAGGWSPDGTPRTPGRAGTRRCPAPRWSVGR